MCENKTVVVNRHKESFDVYIGRGTMWGNPFKSGEDGTRTEVIEEYRKYILYRLSIGSIKESDLLSLKGKRLGCSCKPKACHGDVLVELIEIASDNLFTR